MERAIGKNSFWYLKFAATPFSFFLSLELENQLNRLCPKRTRSLFKIWSIKKRLRCSDLETDKINCPYHGRIVHRCTQTHIILI